MIYLDCIKSTTNFTYDKRTLFSGSLTNIQWQR